MNGLIRDSINAFVQHMMDMESTLSAFSNQIEMKESAIDAHITSLWSHANKLTVVPPKSGQTAEAQHLLNNSLSILKDVYENLAEDISMLRKANTFIKNFEKHFIVMVFGKVKSGKSYMGNYIMGKSISELTDETHYSGQSPFTVYQHDGNKTVVAEKLAEIEEGFEVRATEATNTIQYFYLGGLAWFDTPGIGSVTGENEELAKEYSQNADLIIFVSNSDSAGRRQEFEEIKRLKSMNKPILFIISQSDMYDEDIDENGDIVKMLLPKTDRDRCEVEEYIKDSLAENGLSETIRDDDIITLSTKLALEAIKLDEASLYSSSGMGLFYEKLKILVVPETVMKYKTMNPKGRVNKLLDDISGENRLGCLLTHLSEQKKETIRQRNEILGIVPSVMDRIRQSINSAATEIVERYLQSANIKDKPISGEELSEEANRVIGARVNEIIKEEMTKFFVDVQASNERIAMNNIGELKMRQEEIAYTYTKTYRSYRDPKGLREHIGAFFGKDYYTVETIRETRYKTHDLGINDQEIIQNIINQFDSVEPNLKKYVKGLVDDYFNVHERILSALIQNVNDAKNALLGERIDI